MSSSMRRRRSLMGVSLIGGSCLEVGGCKPLDPQDGAPTPSSSPDQPVTAPAATGSILRAARSRVSGFVPWPTFPVRGTAHVRQLFSGADLTWLRERRWLIRTCSSDVRQSPSLWSDRLTTLHDVVVLHF